MRSSSPEPSVLRIRDVLGLVALLPYLLGFVPRESLVAVAVSGPRDRVRFTLRLDLPSPAERDLVAGECARRMALASADAVLLFVVTEQAHSRDGPPPEAALVAAVRSELGCPVRVALHVGLDRVTCYDALSAGCCPVEGVALDPDGSSSLQVAAAHVLGGRAVLADRDALLRTAAPARGPAAGRFRRAAERVLADKQQPMGERYADVLAEACRRRPLRLRDDEVAVLALGWHEPTVRDEMLGRLAADEDGIDALVREVAARSAPPYDASAAAVLAWSAYLHGDGVVAAAAVERCLRVDSGHSLGRLLGDMLQAQVPPDALREASARFAPGAR